jgi:hypothetical protein
VDIEVVAGIHAGHLLVHFNGRDYLRHDRHWYDARFLLGFASS